MRRYLIFAAATCLGCGSAEGAQFQDLAELDARVSALLQGNGNATPIDRRIKLALCGTAPEISAPSNGSIAVRCPDKGWRLAVLVSGTTIPAVSQGNVVRRGDTIEVLARGDGFTISSTGVAIDDGAAGKSVRVKMPTSSAPISTVVLRPGVVAISF